MDTGVIHGNGNGTNIMRDIIKQQEELNDDQNRIYKALIINSYITLRNTLRSQNPIDSPNDWLHPQHETLIRKFIDRCNFNERFKERFNTEFKKKFKERLKKQLPHLNANKLEKFNDILNYRINFDQNRASDQHRTNRNLFTNCFFDQTIFDDNTLFDLFYKDSPYHMENMRIEVRTEKENKQHYSESIPKEYYPLNQDVINSLDIMTKLIKETEFSEFSEANSLETKIAAFKEFFPNPPEGSNGAYRKYFIINRNLLKNEYETAQDRPNKDQKYKELENFSKYYIELVLHGDLMSNTSTNGDNSYLKPGAKTDLFIKNITPEFQSTELLSKEIPELYKQIYETKILRDLPIIQLYELINEPSNNKKSDPKIGELWTRLNEILSPLIENEKLKDKIIVTQLKIPVDMKLEKYDQKEKEHERSDAKFKQALMQASRGGAIKPKNKKGSLKKRKCNLSSKKGQKGGKKSKKKRQSKSHSKKNKYSKHKTHRNTRHKYRNKSHKKKS